MKIWMQQRATKDMRIRNRCEMDICMDEKRDKKMNQKTRFRGTSLLVAAVLAAGSVTACSSADSDAAAEKTEAAAETAEATTDSATEAGSAGGEGSDSAAAENGDTAAQASAEDTASAEDSAADGSTPYTLDLDELWKANENTKLPLTVTTTNSDATPEGRKITCETAISSVTVDDAGHEALQSALDADYTESTSLMDEEVAALYIDYDDAMENSMAVEYGYSVENTICMKRADEKVVSYAHCYYTNFGGAHPSTSYSTKTYDTATGSELSFEDVVTDYDAVYQYVKDELAAQQSENEYFFDDYETTVEEIFYGPNGVSDSAASSDSEEPVSTILWYLVDDGAAVVMDTYSIAPYAIGPTVIEIPFTSGLIKDAYQ